ncbi:MAG: glycosyltransferase family 4 protein [Gaiellaceae bacterium]
MPELRVGLDVSPLVLTRAGTARYVRCLSQALEEIGAGIAREYSFGGASRPTKIVRDTAWYLGALPMLAARDGLDVLHCPTMRAPLRSRVPLVVTVHDLAVLRYPETFNRWTRSWSALTLPRVARAARRIIAVSELTRLELVEALGVDEARVRVVRNGVGPPFQSGGPAAAGEYVLTVSTLEPRKNLARLVEGFQRAELGLELRIAGARGWGRVDVGGEGVRLLGEVGDTELAELYRGAACVAYVPLYEGFGLPVLEALACGAPVVTARGGACEEVAAGAAELVDPLDPDDIAAGLRRANRRRAELRSLGLARARELTWERTARETLAVYEEAAT